MTAFDCDQDTVTCSRAFAGGSGEDVPQSDALDRKAMRSIVSGSVIGLRSVQIGQAGISTLTVAANSGCGAVS